EVDTDVSSMLKFNGHAETVQKILDLVTKKEPFLLRMNFYQISENQIFCMDWYRFAYTMAKRCGLFTFLWLIC
ncbi:hypothetical protein JYQ73_15060, partial [Anaerostipes hadrus]|nr:hypothetical protein [Anaerostipes hadrus]